MTRDLAFKVLSSFQNGEIVTERMLEKAANTLQIDPIQIIREARFKTASSNAIKSNRDLTNRELDYFSAGLGYTKDHIRKFASEIGVNEKELIFTYLTYGGFVPHEKIAEFDTGSIGDAGLQQDPTALSQYEIAPHQLTSQDPFGNPMVQPSPTAPAQVPPMQGGNMEQLVDNHNNKDQIEQEQLDLANQQMLAQEGQQPGSMDKDQVNQALSQASPEDKAQFAMPGGTPDQLERLATEISKIEEQVGMPIKDPAQLKKIVGEIEKQDKKIIDEAIKKNFEMQTGGNGSEFGPLPGTQQPQQSQQAPQPQQGSQSAQQMAGGDDMMKIAKKLRFL